MPSQLPVNWEKHNSTHLSVEKKVAVNAAGAGGGSTPGLQEGSQERYIEIERAAGRRTSVKHSTETLKNITGHTHTTTPLVESAEIKRNRSPAIGRKGHRVRELAFGHSKTLPEGRVEGSDRYVVNKTFGGEKRKKSEGMVIVG